MRPIFYLLILLSTISACNSPEKEKMTVIEWPNIKEPVAEIKPHTRILHGDTVIDNYYWMIDYFKKGPDSSKIVDYLKAENTYLDQMMKSTDAFQADLFKEMKARIKEKDESVPVFRNGYYYYTRTDTGKEYFKYCRKKGSLSAAEEILLDVDDMAKGHPYFNATGFSVSPDNKLLAFATDKVSRRQYTIQVKNLETGEIYKDEITNNQGKAVWANDNKTFFYTAKNPVTLLSEKIKRHVLGTDPKNDVVVYDEKDNTNYIEVEKSKNGKYIFINSEGTLSNEIRFLDADKPNSEFNIFAPRTKNVLYYVFSSDQKFYVHTNLNAVNFKLMESPLDQTGLSHWKEIIPHRKEVLLEDVEEFKDQLVLSERKNGLNEIRILRNNGDDFYIKFADPVYMAKVGANPDFNSKSLRYIYTSLTTPMSTYDYNVEQKKAQLMKQQEILGGFDAKNYVSERIFATAKDGTKIPIALVYKKGFEKTGKSPLLLYAYGSYGSSTEATFSSARLSLLDRGFVFAIANIRGGQEMGRQWYEDGKLMKKKNSFTDFISAGEFLIDQKYTSKGHLYANGGSAGGLLMGAVVNMAPSLWNGVIADVPFVDVVNTMLDESIPLTTNEFDEWGNPKQKEAYNYLKSYSPYENISAKNYPNILVTTGLHDSQVQYFEPAKWVAKLRATKTDKNVLLLKTNMNFGHGGASGRFDYLNEEALGFTFLFKLEGISK